jgi:copper chaperone CopZ
LKEEEFVMRSVFVIAGSLVVGGVIGVYAVARVPAFRAAVTGSAASTTAPSGTKTVTLKISGMTCEGCTAAVKLAAQRIDGVSAVTVDYAQGRADVTYDAAKTTPASLAKTISETSGYAASLDFTPKVQKAGIAMDALAIPALRDAFNAAKDDTRVVTVLSPTCGECQSGQSVVARAFAATKTTRLKGFIVWLAMKPADSQAAASTQAAEFTDGRVVQGWDANGGIGDAFAKTLALKGRAWDVYAVYEPGVTWTGDAPPKPTFWMHQLTEAAGADQKMCLNPTTFLREVDRIATRK